MNIALRLSFLLCLPAMAMADDGEVVHKRLRQKQAKAGKLPKTTFGYVSTDPTSSCAAAVGAILVSGKYAGCSRYWYNGPGGAGGQDSTCADNPYVAEPSGNNPVNGNPGDNTCLAVGDSPGCFVLEGVNDDEPVLVRTSVAWDWSKYNIPFASPDSSSCATVTALATNPTTINTCADILTDSSIPIVAPDFATGGGPGDGGTTGQCYGKCAFLSAFVTSCLSEEKSHNNLSYLGFNPENPEVPGPVNPGVTTISSTVTFTIDDNEYVCDVTAGGRVCEMWGYSNGYGNNFDSQYIPFQCDDIGGDAYEGYIAYVFDHYLLRHVTDGIGLAPQIVLKRV